MEIELWRCEYEVKCNTQGCVVKAVTLVRHLDEQGRFIRQFELCKEHVKRTLAAGGAKVHDRRYAVPYS
jgi:hypothetical protein